MRRDVIAALVLILAVLCTVFVVVLRHAHAQAPGSADAGFPPAVASAEPGLSLEAAILDALTLGYRQRDGAPIYSYHCREAVGGCPAQARRMTQLFESSGRRHGVDPWLLAAIALRESGGNPNAIGARGELGLMQLHPRGRFGQIAARICDTTPRACAAAIIDGAAQLLASAIRRCGDEAHGLSAYNSGNCDTRLVYAERVFARRDRLRGAR